jgi:hypothetical protein
MASGRGTGRRWQPPGRSFQGDRHHRHSPCSCRNAVWPRQLTWAGREHVAEPQHHTFCVLINCTVPEVISGFTAFGTTAWFPARKVRFKCVHSYHAFCFLCHVSPNRNRFPRLRVCKPWVRNLGRYRVCIPRSAHISDGCRTLTGSV